MSQIVIRKAESADAQILAGFVCDLLTELSGGAAVDLQKIGVLAQLVLASDRVAAALAFEGDTPIGAMTLNECMAIYAGGLFGEISELYIVPDKRSQGVAQKVPGVCRNTLSAENLVTARSRRALATRMAQDARILFGQWVRRSRATAEAHHRSLNVFGQTRHKLTLVVKKRVVRGAR